MRKVRETTINKEPEEISFLKQAMLSERENGNVIRLLRYIKKVCAWDMPETIVNANQGEICVQSTLHNAAIRGVYHKLRNILPEDMLHKIEIKKGE